MAEDVVNLAGQLKALLLPDLERAIHEPLERHIGSLRDEMLQNFDAVWKRFDRLEKLEAAL